MAEIFPPSLFEQISAAVPAGIEAVVFDFDNTWIDFQQADIRALESLCRHTGAPDDPELFAALAIEETIVFHRLVEQNKIDPVALHHYRLTTTCKKLNIPWQDGEILSCRFHRQKICDVASLAGASASTLICSGGNARHGLRRGWCSSARQGRSAG